VRKKPNEDNREQTCTGVADRTKEGKRWDQIEFITVAPDLVGKALRYSSERGSRSLGTGLIRKRGND